MPLDFWEIDGLGVRDRDSASDPGLVAASENRVSGPQPGTPTPIYNPESARTLKSARAGYDFLHRAAL